MARETAPAGWLDLLDTSVAESGLETRFGFEKAARRGCSCCLFLAVNSFPLICNRPVETERKD
jgi:hypothetical protein